MPRRGCWNSYHATTHWAFTPCFAERFPNVLVAEGHPRFVLDRNRLTGGGISSGLDEALMLIQLLQGTVAAQQVQQQTQYYPDPPVSSAIPPAPAHCPLPRPAPAEDGLELNGPPVPRGDRTPRDSATTGYVAFPTGAATSISSSEISSNEA